MTGSAAQSIEQRHSPILLARIEPEGGKETEVDLSDKIISFTYTDSEKKTDKLSLSVDNFDGSAWDTGIFEKGNIIKLRWGYPGFLCPERQVVIKKATGGQVMAVEAEDRGVLMHRTTVCEDYENMTRSDVVRIIAERNGFGSEAQHVEDTGEVIDIINQPNISDARMLKRLAHKHGFQFYIDWDGLHWHSRMFNQTPERVYRWYTDGGNEAPDRILTYNVENDLTAKPARTRLKGMNPKTKKPISQEASEDDTKRTRLQTVVLNRDVKAGEWAQSKRTSSEEDKPTAEDTDSKAKARADGRHKRTVEAAVKMTITVIGDPLLLAKTVIEVQGIAERLTGKYYIKEVVHNIASGYQCTLKLITDGTRGTKGAVSVNEALFPPPKTAKGSGDPFEVSLAAISTINDVNISFITSNAELQAAGLSGQALSRRLDAADRRLTENPKDVGAYQEMRQVGAALRGSGQPRLRKLGKSLETTGQRGVSSAQAAGGGSSGGGAETNNKRANRDRRALVRDPKTNTWIQPAVAEKRGDA